MHARLNDLAVSAGSPDPLGAAVDATGVNFALFSANAEAADLCLFDQTDGSEHRIRLPSSTGDIWHGHIAGVTPGQRYGYRVHGAYDVDAGHRFNPAKLLIDPYTRALDGRVTDDPAIFGYDPKDQGADRIANQTDSATVMPKSIVTAPRPAAERQAPSRNSSAGETVIYEAHVRGLTMRFPGVPDNLRGTFAGLTCESVLNHLRSLGVTAIELLPVHAFYDDRFLTAAGRVNYWGYNSIAFFAPDRRYCGQSNDESNDPNAGFRAMVDRLHEAGFEVILDVVYNHTGEGGHLGPTLMFRGIDNASYYRLMPGDLRHYVNDTGSRSSVPCRPVERSVLVNGQTDRRALGHWPRRLSARRVSQAVSGMERQVSRHRPPLLAR